MYAVELTIGVGLILLGLIAAAYYTYSYTQLSTKIPLLFISEVVATVAIGILYIVCSAVISNYLPPSDLEPVETERVPVNFSQVKEFTNLFDVNNFYNSHPEIMEDVKTINKTDMNNFLLKYRKFFSEMMSEHIRNDSVKKFYLNSHFYDEKMKRSIEKETDECNVEYKEVHLKYVMLVTSFLYGLIAVINSTVEKDNVKVEKSSQVFVRAKSVDTESIISAQSLKDRSVNLINKNKTILQIVLAWLIPIIYTIIVYYTMQTETNNTLESDKLIDIHAQPTTNLISILQKPINVTSTGKEVNEVVSKIYNIVNSVKNNETKKVEASTYPPVMFDIINYFNNRKQKELLFDKCEYKTMPIKLHTLVIFILVYFAAMLYLKTVHTKLKVIKVNNSSPVGRQILAFAGLWMPSVLEIFIRAYLMDYKPNIYSDLSLGVGNVTRFVSNGFNFKEVKDDQKKLNNVTPNV